MLKGFINEGEEGQAAIEYVLLTAGVVFGAVIIILVYQQLVEAAAINANETVTMISEKINESLYVELNKI